MLRGEWNYDGHVIHANVDTDVMLSEEPPYGATDKPTELYAIIEHFANGRKNKRRRCCNYCQNCTMV